MQRTQRAPEDTRQRNRHQRRRQIKNKPAHMPAHQAGKRPQKQARLRQILAAALRHQHHQRPENDIQIAPKGVVAHIQLVQPQLAGQNLAQVGVHQPGALQHAFFITVKHRGRAGHPGAQRKDLARRLRRPVFGNLRVFRARPHQAHLAHQHIPQLRQLVHLAVAQPAAKGRHARVILRRDLWPVIAVHIFAHGAKLENAKSLSPAPHPLAAVKNRPRRIAPDAQRNQGKKRRQQQQPDDRAGDVKQPLGDVFGSGRARDWAWPGSWRECELWQCRACQILFFWMTRIKYWAPSPGP